MSISFESLPVFCVIWSVIGIIILVIAIIRLAYTHEKEESNVPTQEEDSRQLEELFNFFLEEEEKKNQGFREYMMKVVNSERLPEHASNHEVEIKGKKNQGLYEEIITRYKAGESAEMIAKTLKKGVGEVKLIISLYSMK